MILHYFKSIQSTLFNTLVVHSTLCATLVKLVLLPEPNCLKALGYFQNVLQSDNTPVSLSIDYLTAQKNCL